MNNEKLEKDQETEVHGGLLTDVTGSKPTVQDKPLLTKLPWGVVKEKPHSIYNKSLLLNLKNKTTYESALTELTSTASEKELQK